MKLYNGIIILTFVLGMVALFVAPNMVPILWALPAGTAAGEALVKY